MVCAAFAVVAQAQHSLSAPWISYVGAEMDWDAVYAIATDSRTNAYFGGQLGVGVLANTDEVEMAYPFTGEWGVDGDGFVAKVGADGTLQWSTCLSRGLESAVRGLAHTGGAVYAGGAFENYWDALLDSDTRTDAILTKLDDGTGACEWSRALGEAEGAGRFCTTNSYTAVAADAAGNVYAVGHTTIADLPAGPSAYSGGMDAVVVKYNAGGTMQWIRYLGGTNRDRATAVAIGADGSVYVVGETWSQGWATLGDNALSGPASCGFLAKLDSSGTVLYSTLLGGGGTDRISAVLKDAASDALILAGQTSSSDFCQGLAVGPVYGTMGFVMGLDDLGTFCATNWFRFVGGTGSSDGVTALARMANGQVIAGGVTDSGGWLDTQGEGALGYHGSQDGFLLQLDTSSGAPLWATYVGGAKDDGLYAVAVEDETVFAGGYTFSPGLFAYNGFWEDWAKETFGDYGYGFIGKWTQGEALPPEILTDLDDLFVHEGEPAEFVLFAEATPKPAYYWLRDGLPVPGESNTYTIASTALPDDGTEITCIVSNVFGCATSQVARLTVIANASLTATLTPQQAIAQGAQWSMDNGTTWHNSEAPLTLRPDDYTLTFAPVTGWATPTNQTVSVAPGSIVNVSANYTPILAQAVRSVSGTNVTLAVQMPQEVTGWTLVETLPSGLTPTVHDGAWDSGARTLTFSGTTSTALTYTVAAASSGIYTPSGQIASSPAGMSAHVTGDSQIIHAHLFRVINGTQVTIHLKDPSAYLMISETMPAGLDVIPSSVSPGGMLTGSTLYWMFPSSQTLSYEVTGAPGTYSLTGQGTPFEAIYGDSTLVIAATVPTPEIIGFTVQGTVGKLTFTSVLNQPYMVQTNATLASGWHDCLPVAGDAPTTTIYVPATAPSLFYRVGVQ